jgi:acetyltransferase-like isoleucine patch superfamily enzyme
MKTKTYLHILRSIPNIFWIFKIFFIKHNLNKIGSNFHFGPNCLFYDPNLIEVGNNVFIGDRSMISTNVKVSIGNDVMFGPEVMVLSGDHNFSIVGKPMRSVKEGGKNFPIIIENDVWIGAKSLILKGVKIGEGSIIGALSLVNKDILPYSINVGNPCKYSKARFTIEELNTHLEKVNSIYSISDIKDLYKNQGINLQ